MTDINSRPRRTAGRTTLAGAPDGCLVGPAPETNAATRDGAWRDADAPPRVPPTGAGTHGPIDIVELLFFAYRDFTGDPDSILDAIGFGRAHHRVLHFVTRNPGLRVADLLVILRITKQSLSRVLKQLIDEGYVAQRAGASDRRARLLHPTSKGAALAARLQRLQVERIAGALAEIGPAGEIGVRAFLMAMVRPEDRARVAALLDGGVDRVD